MTDALKPRFDGPWIIAACFITFGIASGFPYYNIAFFYDYMRDDHGWSPQILTFGAPLAVMLTIWAGPLIVPRVSPRKLIVFGTGMIFLAFQWFAHMGASRFWYYGAWCLWMLGYFTAGPIPHQIILSNWYRRRAAARWVSRTSEAPRSARLATGSIRGSYARSATGPPFPFSAPCCCWPGPSRSSS